MTGGIFDKINGPIWQTIFLRCRLVLVGCRSSGFSSLLCATKVKFGRVRSKSRRVIFEELTKQFIPPSLKGDLTRGFVPLLVIRPLAGQHVKHELTYFLMEVGKSNFIMQLGKGTGGNLMKPKDSYFRVCSLVGYAFGVGRVHHTGKCGKNQGKHQGGLV